MKKIFLSIVLFLTGFSLYAQTENQDFISGLIKHYLAFMAIGLGIIFIINYFFLRYTFNVKEFQKKMDYNNQLLELLVLKKDVTKEEINELRILALSNEEEIVSYRESKIANKINKDDSEIADFINQKLKGNS